MALFKMIPNMSRVCKLVSEIKDHAKNFPNASRKYWDGGTGFNCHKIVEHIVLANSASLVGMPDMWHLIWFFNVEQSTHLGCPVYKGFRRSHGFV